VSATRSNDRERPARAPTSVARSSGGSTAANDRADASPILGAIRASRLLNVIASAPVAAIVAAVLGPTSHARAAAAPAPVPRPFLVALDAGHGGSADPADPSKPYDSGAVGTNGLLEKDLALDEVFRIQRLLVAQGVDVLLTRDSDVLIDITPRMQKAIDAGADLFVSVHFNGWTDPAAGGSLVLYPKDFCQPFATRLASSLARALGPFGVLPDGLQYRPEMFQHATMPTATIEPLFLTNPTEAALMTRDDVRDAIARSVVDAVDAQAGPDIAERRAVANGWAAIAAAFGGAGPPVVAAPPAAAAESLDSSGVAAGAIVPLPTPVPGAPTPIPVLGGGHADASPRASPTPAAGGRGGTLTVTSTPDPGAPWLRIALGLCAIALVVVLRRPVLHALAVVSAASLRGIARLDGHEVPSLLRLQSREGRRVARRRALLDRRGTRTRAAAGRGATYGASYFRAAPVNRARRR
jgi:N-acetylmuramoyl-L-alanine amidase